MSHDTSTFRHEITTFESAKANISTLNIIQVKSDDMCRFDIWYEYCLYSSVICNFGKAFQKEILDKFFHVQDVIVYYWSIADILK